MTDVFGTVRSQSGTGDTMFKFTGEQRDADSGMYYLRARYYDPGIGRFLGQDPLPLLNRYTYVRNNPLNYTDPLGLFSHPDLTPDFVDDAVDAVIDEGSEMISDAYDEGKKIWNAGCNPYVAAIGCATPALLDALHLEGLGYVDLNGTVCIYLCLTGGLQASFGQGIHPYAGSGLGYGAGVSATVAPGQSISTGWNCGLQGSYGFLAAQAGAGIDIKEGGLKLDPWVEIGVTLAVSTPTYTCYYVW